jgi:hypothetical protein
MANYVQTNDDSSDNSDPNLYESGLYSDASSNSHMGYESNSGDRNDDSDDDEWHGILKPPPTGLFNTFKELIESTNAHGRTEGFTIIQERSLKSLQGKGVHIKSYLCCDRGGKNYKSRAKVRKMKSKWIDCSFSVIAKYIIEEGKWSLTIRRAKHNHGPCRHLICHRPGPIYR